jgi:hypothetical protein
MRDKTMWSVLLAGAVAVCTGLAACSSDKNEGSTLTSGGQGGSNSNSGAGTGGDLFSTSGGEMAVLKLEPKSATIEVVNGMSPVVTFKAKVGKEEVFPGTWYVDRADVATVNSSGVFTALNNKGAQVRVFAKENGQVAEAVVNVIYKKVTDGGVPDDEKAKLDQPSGQDQTVTWTYPYDGTVWPRGLLAPELMWKGATAGDSYLISFKSTYLDLKVYAKAPQQALVVDQADWVSISESGNGSTVDVKVARLTPGQPAAQDLISHKWRMAKASMRGSVYYWVNNLGRVVRLKPGQPAPDDFLAAAGVKGCSTCHSVSANGQTMIIGGDVNVSTFDLLNNQPVFTTTKVGKGVRNWAMPAISPDGKLVVENNAPLPGPPGGSDGIFVADTGLKVPNSGLEGVKLWMPAFAPKGHKLVYVDPAGSHDLATYEFDLGLGQAKNPYPLVAAGNDPSTRQICFPSVSPTIKSGENDDGKTWAVYHRGTPASLETTSGPGYLYLASVDTPGVEIRLSNANGDNYPFAAGDRDRGYDYEPTFAPQASGGYMWVVFTSRRTYGTKLTGHKSNTKQLWVTAIELNPQPGKDPSHPAFWLAGQNSEDLNMRAFWALDPCIQQGNSCKADSDCCDGSPCLGGKCGGPSTCVEVGEYCEEDADCCDPEARCLDNTCDYNMPN